jgi:hypothetical protein
LKTSPITKEIEANIEEKLYAENIRKIKKAQRTSKRKISHKYSPASRKKEYLYITEGLCLEENQKIFILRRGCLRNIKIKDVKEGDLVITHENRWKPILHKNKSIKKEVKIYTSLGILNCSENHKWFIYDTDKKIFHFVDSKSLNKNIHKLVKNYLSFLESFDEVSSVEKKDKIIITNDKNEKWEITKNNNICYFDESNNFFNMKKSDDIERGDIIVKFNNPF